MPINEELPILIDKARSIARDAETAFGTLSADKLNWKARPGDWSIAQCFEHLIAINSAYFPIIEKIKSGQYRHSWKERIPLLPKLFGKLLINAVKPSAPRKFKAAAEFEPPVGPADARIIQEFSEHQEQLIEHMSMNKEMELRETVITSPVASFITYSLLDAYKIIIAHEQRHVAQAKRVMNEMLQS